MVAAAAVVDLRSVHAAPGYDEGVYLSSLRELQHGAALGDPLFTSQPPGFYWLLRLVGVAGSSPASMRIGMIGLALAGIVAAWWLVRGLAGPVAGIVTAATLSVAPPWPAESARIEADTPSTALALGALALARGFPGLAGALLAAAVLVKLLAVAAVVPFVLLARHQLARAAAGAAVASAAILLPTLTTLDQVWQQAVRFHLEARTVHAPSLGANLARVVHFVDLRTPFGLLTVGTLAYAVVHVVRRRALPGVALWSWTLGAAVLLVLQRPLFDHHTVLLAAALAVPVGATAGNLLGGLEGRLRTAAAVAFSLLVAAGLAQQWRQLGRTPGTPRDATIAAAVLRARLPAGSTVASDVQIVPYLAGLRQPPQLVDVSYVRLASGELTAAEVLRASRGAAGFVVGRELQRHAAILTVLRERYRSEQQIGTLRLYLCRRAARRGCA